MLVDAIYVLFLLSSPLRSSRASVVFDFSAPLSAVVPASPILLPVDLMRTEEWFVNGCHFCIVYFVLTTQIEVSECFV